ncbi:MAG TPA: shikimate kinase [Candidatus Eisenbacteria bacterium]|nr:shikimate kinase [Candidatus Eisenbacteria bacterium]
MGLPGAGKSSVGPILAARLNGAFDDLDALVAREAGRGVAEILREEGEAAFRALEREALRRALGPRRGEAAPAIRVLACGGGIVTDRESRELLASGATVVWLTVRPETALERLGAAGVAARPLLAGPGEGPADVAGADAGPGGARSALARLERLQASRNPLYHSIAALALPTEGRSPKDVAAEVEAALRKRWDISAS